MILRQRFHICQLKMFAGLVVLAVALVWGTPLSAGGNAAGGFSLDDESLQDLFPTWDQSPRRGVVQPQTVPNQPHQVMPPVVVPMPMPLYTMPVGQPAVQAPPVQVPTSPSEPAYVYPPVPLKPAGVQGWTPPPAPLAGSIPLGPVQASPVPSRPSKSVAGQSSPAAQPSSSKAQKSAPKAPPAAVAVPLSNQAAGMEKSAAQPSQAGTLKTSPMHTKTDSDLMITQTDGHTIYELTPASVMAVASPDFFTLDECIAIALEVNPNMMNAAWSVMGAEWEKKKAAGDFLPSARLRYSYSMLDETPTSSSQGHTAVVGHRENYSMETTITQPIFKGFALLSQYQLAQLGLDTAEIRKFQARLDLILETKQYYFLLLQARKSLEVARQSVQQLEAHLKDAKHYYEVGLVPKIQYLEAQVKLAQAVQNQTVAQNDVEYACARMNTLLRRPIDSPLEVLDLTNPQAPGLQLNDCMAEALLNRPEILVAEQQIKASDQEIRMAASGFYPNVSLAYNYENEGDTWEVNGSKFKDSTSWNVAAQADWTVWDWGRTYKDVQIKKTEQYKAYNTLDQVKEMVVLEVKKNYLTLESATQNIDVSRQAMDQAEENYRLNNERYQAQIATSTEVTDAQTLLTQAKINYYNAVYQMALAKAALERAMGVEEADL